VSQLRRSTAETLLREHNDPKIKLELVKISKRRWGIRRRIALLMPAEATPPVQITAGTTTQQAKQAITDMIASGLLVRLAPNVLLELAPLGNAK
jgi:hypothetical protein